MCQITDWGEIDRQEKHAGEVYWPSTLEQLRRSRDKATLIMIRAYTNDAVYPGINTIRSAASPVLGREPVDDVVGDLAEKDCPVRHAPTPVESEVATDLLVTGFA